MMMMMSDKHNLWLAGIMGGVDELPPHGIV